MSDIVVWIIIVAFYAPLHFLLPVLTVVLSAENSELRWSGIRSAILMASLSMLIAFALVIYLVQISQISIAMAVLFLSLLFPIARVLYLRWRGVYKA